MNRAHTAALLLLAAAGCTGTQEIRRPGETPEYVVSCGFLNWEYCYDRANAICPERYKMLEHVQGMGGRQLRISCPPEKLKAN